MQIQGEHVAYIFMCVYFKGLSIQLYKSDNEKVIRYMIQKTIQKEDLCCLVVYFQPTKPLRTTGARLQLIMALTKIFSSRFGPIYLYRVISLPHIIPEHNNMPIISCRLCIKIPHHYYCIILKILLLIIQFRSQGFLSRF